MQTAWTYDGFGRRLTEPRPDGTQTATQYLLCTPGNGVPPRAVYCTRTQSSGSGPATTYYDVLDRPIRQDFTGFDGRIVSTHGVYNEKGEAISTSLPFFSSTTVPTAPTGQYTAHAYDAISRETQQAAPAGQSETALRVTGTVYAGLTTTVTNRDINFEVQQ